MIALFPLSQPLFPDGILALRVFETRYLSLIDRCQRDDVPFGVVTLQDGYEVQVEGTQETFTHIGCMAHIAEVRELQPGLLAVHCVGGDRFRVTAGERDGQGLWHAEVQMLEPDLPTDIPPDLQPMADRLGALIADSQRQGIEDRLPVTRPYRLDECGWVANQWAHLVNLGISQKISILDEDDPLTRLTIVKMLLDRPDPDLT